MAKAKRRRGVHTSRRKTWKQKWREYIWPSMGIWAWLEWVKLNLMRQAHQPHKVALGFAIGVWICFFPILGTHLILAIFFCWMFGASMLAAVLGSVVGNPWTYPFILTFSHRLGMRLLGIQPEQKVSVPVAVDATPGQSEMTMSTPHHYIHSHSIDFFSLVGHLDVLMKKFLWPTMVGGAVIGLVVAVIAYGLVYWQVRIWGQRKLEKKK